MAIQHCLYSYASLYVSVCTKIFNYNFKIQKMIILFQSIKNIKWHTVLFCNFWFLKFETCFKKNIYAITFIYWQLLLFSDSVDSWIQIFKCNLRSFLKLNSLDNIMILTENNSIFRQMFVCKLLIFSKSNFDGFWRMS